MPTASIATSFAKRNKHINKQMMECGRDVRAWVRECMIYMIRYVSAYV